MTGGRADIAIASFAVAHDGVFPHNEVLAAGLTQRQVDRRLRSGAWVRVLPRVYRNAATPLTDAARRRAALWWAGRNAVLSHRSAATIWGLDGIQSDGRPELMIAGVRHPRSELVVVHRTLALAPDDVCRRDGQRVTRPMRTIIDLAAVLNEEALEIALESARRMRLVADHRLRRRLESLGGRGRAGATQLRALLDAVAGQPPAEYTLEVKVARLLRRSALPQPVRQHRVRIFGRGYRLDFAWPQLRVALECDGRMYHEFQRDRTRWRQLGASGWRVLPVTWADATHRWPTILRELNAALASAA
jgi:very-short-patch-repair endonuclease